MPSDPRQALEDIRNHIVLAQTWTGALTIEQFANDQQIFYAVTRCLAIISEAARRLPDDMLKRHPAIIWRAVKAAGNVYRHQYEDVLEKDVWNTVHHHLPTLAAFVQAEQGEQGDLS